MKVLAALSGGVDSSVAAAMLLDEGHEVVAATMKLWGGESDTGCCSVSDVEDARRSAAQLGIDHHVFNYTEQFERQVVEPYVADHAAGRTPNPCVECNRHLKFDVLLDRAELLGFDAVATGHHARIIPLDDGSLRIGRGTDPAKDQAYVLHPLLGTDLSKVRFPIGHLTKDEVRAIASDRGLRTATKPDSQDVCFITRAQGRREFLERRIALHPAKVLDADGTQVGEVAAVELVTIGQRRGLELAGGAERRFVTSVDVPARTVTVGSEQDLLTREVVLGDVATARPLITGEEVLVQCSAHGAVRAAEVTRIDESVGELRIEWHEPSRRVAPGQSVVLFGAVGLESDTVVAGGVVQSRETANPRSSA